VAQLFGRILGDGVVSSIKGGTLFLPQAWKGARFDKIPAAFEEKFFAIPVDDTGAARLAEEVKITREQAKSLLTGHSAVQMDLQ